MSRICLGGRRLCCVVPDGVSSRRTAVAVLALVVLTAGCAGLVGDDSDGAPLDDVPAEADALIHVESGILTDPTTETLMDGLVEMDEELPDSDAPGSWEEVLEETEEESDLDVDDFHSATLFMSDETIDEGEEYAGVILQSDFEWEDLEELAEEDSEFDGEDTYNGVTVYVDDDEFNEFDTWAADFGDGTFAFGPEPVVRDVIDTHQGDADGIDEDLRDAYEGTTEGYVTAAFVVSDDQEEVAGEAAEAEGIEAAAVPETEALTMSYHTEGENMTVEMNLITGSTDEAEQFTSVVESVLGLAELEGDADAPPGEDPLGWAVESLSVEQEDERVSMSFATDPEDLLDVLEALAEPVALEDEFAKLP